LDPADGATDWSKSYAGLSEKAFPKEAADILMAPLEANDIEIKPGAFCGVVDASSLTRTQTEYCTSPRSSTAAF
jgi:hypothetical protein